MPPNPPLNCCPTCPSPAPSTLTCTINGSSFPISAVGGSTIWLGSGGAICGGAFTINLICGGTSDWTLDIGPTTSTCVGGQTSFQVLSSNPVLINFVFVPPSNCCQTDPIDGTINQ